MRRTRGRTQSIGSTDYKRFHNHGISENVDLIEDFMTDECEQTDLKQALKYEN